MFHWEIEAHGITGQKTQIGDNSRLCNPVHHMIGRRAFVAGAAATLIAVPYLAWAQPATNIPRIALFDRGAPPASMTEDGHPFWGALLGELRRLGYVEGESTIIDRRSGGGQADEGLFREARLGVDTRPDLIVARGRRPMRAFMAATTTIPIVGIGTYPAGAYASLARPGGNITGVEGSLGPQFYAKHVQLLHDAVPTASRIAWLGSRGSWEDGNTGAAARAGAEQLGLALVPVIVDSPVTEATVRQAFDAMARQSFDALYVSPSTDVYAHRRLVAKLVAAARLPAVGRQRQYAEAGLLMTLGPSIAGNFQRGAWYVDQILKGAIPSELPIEQPTTLELIVNLKTASELGITLPPAILIQATKFIE